jgi:hypothetical protein
MTLALRFDNHIHLLSANNLQVSLGSDNAKVGYWSLKTLYGGIPI